MAKVKDIFPMDEDEIHLAAARGPGDYWQTVKTFYERVKELDASALSDRQVAWLGKLPEQLEEAMKKAEDRMAR